VLCLLCALLATGCERPAPLILASTTSTADSGLLDVLVPAFEDAYTDLSVKVIAVGSGEALALGRRGDADVLLVHSPADEQTFMAAGHGARRLGVMANDYVIAGPPADPAGIRGGTDAVAALRRIAEQNAAFISRGDNSGTHRKELALWGLAGSMPERRVEVGQGMGEALGIASERGTYILTDRGTYLALSQALELDVLVEGDPLLRNTYSVITVRGARNAHGADLLTDWLVSEDAAALIRSFGVDRVGEPLFIPAADLGR
jgi:tungstate transport system substrate-binding protein